MPQLVSEIVLSDKDYGIASGCNRVQAVVEYVNGLAERYLYLNELPPRTVQSYYADYYMCQVLNGNIHQFVWNSRWAPDIVEAVAEALSLMGLRDQGALFDEVRDFVGRDPSRLQEFLRSDSGSSARAYMEEMEGIGGKFFDRFTAHPDGYKAGCYQIARANQDWISSWPEVKWVSDETFARELDRLATVVPDLEARKAKAREARPWQYKRIEEVIAVSGQKLLRLTAVDPVASALGTRGEIWHCVTEAGHHRIMFANGEAVMMNGERDDVVARVAAPEAVSKAL